MLAVQRLLKIKKKTLHKFFLKKTLKLFFVKNKKKFIKAIKGWKNMGFGKSYKAFKGLFRL